ncbi:MAG: multiubiquitin domain-containing protein [Bacteroidetes bacterium]|nr:multiubiquitin domain-containing protein [Bacteroidota bacterium]
MSKKTDNDEKNEQGKHVLHFEINGKDYQWHQQYITGAEIRKLGEIPKEDEIFLAIKKPWKDEPIMDDTKVDLARPEIEHFFSKKHGEHDHFTIIVNGREKEWNERTISFEQVVILAFGTYVDNGTTVYTVTYKRGHEPKPEGTMVKGDVVRVKNKMIFNVTATDKS